MIGHFTSRTCKHEHYVPAHRAKGDVQLQQTRLVIALDRNKECPWVRSKHWYRFCLKYILFKKKKKKLDFIILGQSSNQGLCTLLCKMHTWKNKYVKQQ